MVGKRLLWAAPVLAVPALCRMSPAFAAAWRRGMGAWYALAARASGPLPRPLLESLILLALALPAFCLLRRRFRTFLRLAAMFPALLLAGYALLWLPLFYGPDARPFPVSPASPEDLARTAEALAEAVSGMDGVPAPEDLPDRAVEAVRALEGLPFAEVAPPRTFGLRGWMPALGLAGLFSPWTGEALFSPEAPAAARPFTACHELAHMRGLADEGQANIAAWQACVGAGAAFRRSACLHALASILPRLWRTDHPAWERCVAPLDAGTLADLRAMGGLTGGKRRECPARAALLDLLGIRQAAESYGDLADYLARGGLEDLLNF